MITTPDNIAVDSNVLIYLHDFSDKRKRRIAQEILADNPKIPMQVISEYLNITRRILTLSKEDLLEHAARLFAPCNIVSVVPATLQYASALVKRYQFQLFDAVIVAASIESGCQILYSEDMQHKLVADNMLTILNPFV